MSLSRVWSTATVTIGLLAGAMPAIAQAPGVYYAWRAIETDLIGCIDRATAAFSNQELQNIQVEANSVSGSTEDATALLICMVDGTNTNAMVVVSSVDDDIAFELRESLKAVF